jgi:protein-disulfide isomerase
MLFHDPDSPALGNPDGDVTIVEFFDYRCPYCRRVAPDLEALLAEDPGVRLVFKEWPILGRASVEAARAALAAHFQGHYAAVHHALMAGDIDADADDIVDFAVSLGADPAALRDAMGSDRVSQALIANNELADALHFTGTPGFVVNDRLVPGAVSLDQLRAIVADVRTGS